MSTFLVVVFLGCHGVDHDNEETAKQRSGVFLEDHVAVFLETEKRETTLYLERKLMSEVEIRQGGMCRMMLDDEREKNGNKKQILLF